MKNTDIEGVGFPVEIGKIDKELGKLWEEAGESKTRASLINLVLYFEDSSQVHANTQLIAEIATEHACRAILILAEPGAAESGAKAWINAHCHLAGKRQICSEQITFHLAGETAQALPSIVFSHLDSDLPLCLWWQAPFQRTIDEQLWSWVDRLVFDSACWPEPPPSFEIIRKIGSLGEGRTVLGDLNWARILETRIAIAGLFDHAMALEKLPKLESIAIDHAPGHRTTALLLIGWLASRLGWKLQPLLDKPFFVAPSGIHVPFDLTEKPGPPISRCLFTSGECEFLLKHCDERNFFEATVSCPGCQEHPRITKAGRDNPADLLLSELGRGSRHGHYRHALEAILPLL
ncbi:MAG: glucose-6-phosphate dehydrogenase assembly protein OpcA [Terrimicrobiaceae bacterium]